MRENDFEECLKRVLGTYEYEAMVAAKMGLVRMTNAAAMKCFMDQKPLNSIESITIRSELENLEVMGCWSWAAERQRAFGERMGISRMQSSPGHGDMGG